MTTLVRMAGLGLLVLVGYHYVNAPLGLSVAGSIATAVFGICLMGVYRDYHPNRRNWLGWVLIAAGCVVLAAFESFSFALVTPAALIVAGYRLAELPFDVRGGGDAGGGDFGGDGDFFCDGDGGD